MKYITFSFGILKPLVVLDKTYSSHSCLEKGIISTYSCIKIWENQWVADRSNKINARNGIVTKIGQNHRQLMGAWLGIAENGLFLLVVTFQCTSWEIPNKLELQVLRTRLVISNDYNYSRLSRSSWSDGVMSSKEVHRRQVSALSNGDINM